MAEGFAQGALGDLAGDRMGSLRLFRFRRDEGTQAAADFDDAFVHERAIRVLDGVGVQLELGRQLGIDVKLARDETVAKGVVINGLVILSDRPVPWNAEHTNPPGGLEKYYQDNVIGGPGAFVLVAENFNSFGRAIIKKLIAEIAALSPASHPASHIVVR